MKYRALIPVESRLEGVNRQNLKFTTLNTLQTGVSVRTNIKSERERERGKQINQEIKRMNTVVCFTEVWF
jgi:hypothetical protein